MRRYSVSYCTDNTLLVETFKTPAKIKNYTVKNLHVDADFIDPV